jgi:hypothetical protein
MAAMAAACPLTRPESNSSNRFKRSPSSAVSVPNRNPTPRRHHRRNLLPPHASQRGCYVSQPGSPLKECGRLAHEQMRCESAES